MRAADNPFRSECIEALLYRFPAGTHHAALFQRLDAQSGRGALVGPQGSGKTTLMLEMERQAKLNGWKTCYIRLTESDRRLLWNRLGSVLKVLQKEKGHGISCLTKNNPAMRAGKEIP